MIYSEYQVFEAIMKWVNFKTHSRKCYLERLFKLVRWCHLEDKDSSRIKEQFQSLNCQPSKLCSSKNCDCDLTGNRTKQEHFIEIYKLNDTSLRIIISDINFYPLIEQVVKLNDSMTIDIFHDEHVSDIFFDCGKEGIRIDWKLNEYRLLDKSQFKTYYIKIHHVIKEKKSFEDNFLGKKWRDEFNDYGVELFEASEKFILFSNSYAFSCWPANSYLIEKYFRTDSQSYTHGTILEDDIYLYNISRFAKINIHTHEVNHIDREWFSSRLCFHNVLITSRKANDDRVILINKSTKDAFCFNVNTQQCSSMGRIFDCNREFPVVQNSVNKLLSLTSTFISMDTMRTCSTHNDNSKNQRCIT